MYVVISSIRIFLGNRKKRKTIFFQKHSPMREKFERYFEESFEHSGGTGGVIRRAKYLLHLACGRNFFVKTSPQADSFISKASLKLKKLLLSEEYGNAILVFEVRT